MRVRRPTVQRPAILAAWLFCCFAAPLIAMAESLPEIEGSWELVEWTEEGEVRRAPQIGGRFSLHDGVVLFQAFRKTADGEISTQGFGSYRFEGDSFFFDYDRLVRIVIRRGAAPEVTEVAFSPKRFASHREGTRIVLTSAEENRSFVVDGNTMQYVENGKPLRTYRRIGNR